MSNKLPAGFSDTAMVLAAGQGMRMRPLTLTKPKPLFEVGGRTMLDQALEKLKEAGIGRVVVNCHYLADQIEAHLTQRRDLEIILSREEALLDTGGGIKNVLSEFGGKPFFALNADLPCLDNTVPALERMAAVWDEDRMDALLLLMRRGAALGFDGPGDFMLEPDARVWRRNAPKPRSHVCISAQILKPHLFDEVSGKAFSNNKIWDDAETRGTLFGVEHDGTCYHVGTVADLAEANRLLANGIGWRAG